MIVILMGVAGSGKTTIARRLAKRLGWSSADADDFHSPANRDKMSRGIPLTDTDRQPWLDDLRKHIALRLQRGESEAIACSALKRTYRDYLRVDQDAVSLVYLRCDKPTALRRLQNRNNHYMKENMVDSQFETLEEPTTDERAVVFDCSIEPDEIVTGVCVLLKLDSSVH